MKKPQSILSLCLAVLLMLAAFPAGLAAAEDGPGFLVEPVYPDNQRTRSGFFDLRVQPGASQELTLRVKNEDSAPIEVEVEVLNASTAPYGFIDYATAGIADESLRHPLDTLAAAKEPVVAIPAGGQEDVAVTLQAPPEAFDGVILGAVRVRRRDSAGSGGMIDNQYQYAVAVMLSANDDPVEPDFELVDVAAGLENYRAAVVAQVRNTMPAMAKDIDVAAELLMDGEQVFSMDRNIDMAPSSVWECQLVDRKGYGFPAGEYLLRMRMEREGREWAFERAFTISGGEAEYINSNAVNQSQVRQPAYPAWAVALCAAGCVLILLVLILLIALLRRKRNV